MPTASRCWCGRLGFAGRKKGHPITTRRFTSLRPVALVVSLVLAMAAVLPLPGVTPPAEAVVFDPYDVRFQTTAPGDITLVSNTLLTCQPRHTRDS